MSEANRGGQPEAQDHRVETLSLEDQEKERQRIEKVLHELGLATQAGLIEANSPSLTMVYRYINQAREILADPSRTYNLEALSAHELLTRLIGRAVDEQLDRLSEKFPNGEYPNDVRIVLDQRKNFGSVPQLVAFFSSPVVVRLRQQYLGLAPNPVSTLKQPETKEQEKPLPSLNEAIRSGSIDDLKRIALSDENEAKQAQLMLKRLATKPKHAHLAGWITDNLATEAPSIPAQPTSAVEIQPSFRTTEAFDPNLDREQIERKIESLKQELLRPAPTVQVIADVHGSDSYLEQTIDQYSKEYGAAEKIIFLGDFIDRGPRSLAVLDIVKGLVQDGKAEFTLGNHEAMMLATILEGNAGAYNMWLYNGGREVAREVRSGTELNTLRNNRTLRNWAEWLYENGHIRLYKDKHLYTHAGLPLYFDGSLAETYNKKTGLEALDDMEQDLRDQRLQLSHWYAGETSPLFAAAGDRSWEWYDLLKDVDAVFKDLNTDRPADDQIVRLVHGHTPTTRDYDNRGGQLQYLVRSKPEWKKKVLGIDTGMSDAYGGHGGSLYLDKQGIQFRLRRPEDQGLDAVIDDKPRTIADTDRGRDINREIAQLKRNFELFQPNQQTGPNML